MTNNIALGTANFGVKYGVDRKVLEEKNLKKIINLAKIKNVKIIDTSTEYLNSEKVLGNLNISDFKIVTKIKIPNDFVNRNIKQLERKFFKSLKELKVKKVYGLLFQNCEEIVKKKNYHIFNFFLRLKQKGYIEKIGFSVYCPKVLRDIIKIFKFDIIQIPINIFDQRFLKSKILFKLKKNNVEIHARSIFFHGLLLKKNLLSFNKFYINQNFKEWESFVRINNINKLKFLINFVSNIKEIDFCVVGFENFNQFKKILSFSKKKNKNYKKFKPRFNSKFFDLRLWNNK